MLAHLKIGTCAITSLTISSLASINPTSDIFIHTHPSVAKALASTCQGVEKVKEEQGGFAFMMEDAGIQYLIERNCELAQVTFKLISSL